eukprot:6543767-Prorocentrum_lima.AAC.1
MGMQLSGLDGGKGVNRSFGWGCDRSEKRSPSASTRPDEGQHGLRVGCAGSNSAQRQGAVGHANKDG